MLQISGYLLVRETGVGIPNLVVTAFDSGGASEVIQKQSPTAEVMKRLGRRMSTVFTDEQGMFFFSTEDLEFAGNEPRPDLVIVVFAPEDIVDPAQPYPRPPEDRVLYMSVVPRIDAGAQEAFLIRLSNSVLLEQRVDAGRKLYANTLEEQWRSEDALSDRMLDRHRFLLERKADARKEAVERTKNLHGVPVAQRANEFLVVGKAKLSRPSEDSDGKVTHLEALQYKTVSNGLKKLKAAKAKRTMRLYLTDDDLAKVGLRMKDRKISGKPTHEQVKSLMLSLTGGVDLVRIRGMQNPSPEELESRYLNVTTSQESDQPEAYEGPVDREDD
jgi:hypothetical protein